MVGLVGHISPSFLVESNCDCLLELAMEKGSSKDQFINSATKVVQMLFDTYLFRSPLKVNIDIKRLFYVVNPFYKFSLACQ